MIRRGSASLTRPLVTRMIRRSSSRRPAWVFGTGPRGAKSSHPYLFSIEKLTTRLRPAACNPHPEHAATSVMAREDSTPSILDMVTVQSAT
jgi:hypothetical protein